LSADSDERIQIQNFRRSVVSGGQLKAIVRLKPLTVDRIPTSENSRLHSFHAHRFLACFR
jgi:hypothetical protein